MDRTTGKGCDRTAANDRLAGQVHGPADVGLNGTTDIVVGCGRRKTQRASSRRTENSGVDDVRKGDVDRQYAAACGDGSCVGDGKAITVKADAALT